MDRSANARDPTHQESKQCSPLDTLGELLELDFRTLRR